MTTTKKQLEKAKVESLISVNPDAREYFYSRVSPEHFEWLVSNGFLDPIKKKPDDSVRFIPELEYLVRVSASKPKEAIDFMLSVDVPATLNTGLVSRFIWILGELNNAEQLARIVPKMKDEKWIQLLTDFNHWTYQYEKMFKTLSLAGDQETILKLAELVLAVRPKEDLGKGNFRSKDQPFYFDDISETEVFDCLNAMEGERAEQALKLTAKTLGEVVLLAGEKEDDVFTVGEIFTLFDVDFFTFTGGNPRGSYAKEEVKDLAATTRNLVQKLISNRCESSDNVREIYNAYISTLPDARTMWRFRLFVWSQCPEVFKEELKSAFFRLFEVEKKGFWAVAGGAEYEQALKQGFSTLNEPDQREYVRRSLELFSSMEKPTYGYGIFSSIYSSLTSTEIEKIENMCGRPLNPDYVPEPSVGRITSGTIIPQLPPNSEEDWGKSVAEIVSALKTNWSPAEVRKLDTKRDFLRPINAEGIGDRLKEEIKKRPTDFFNAAELFFDRENLDSHYTYSYLRGLADALKITKQTDVDWSGLMRMFGKFIVSGEENPMLKGVRRDADTWLSDWQGVHDALADLVKDLLSGEDILPFAENRKALLDFIAYLLKYPDPIREPYEPPTKNRFSGNDEYTRSDPFTEAINSVRGRAFQAFVNFIYPDGKQFAKDTPVKIAADVKQIYEDLLSSEDTEALMFIIGHYIPTFYYRDAEWMRSRFAQIFPLEADKKDLFIASAEGYLSTSLYKELFTELEFVYKRLISLRTEDYTKRRYFGEIDETLSGHIALAYMHFEVDTNSRIFRSLWWSTPERRQHFISFIGRHAISRDNAKKWCEEQGVNIEKLKALWDWVLNIWTDQDVFSEFGFWIDTKKEIFEIEWLANRTKRTLEKSKGVLDWEYGMMKSMPDFIKVTPEDALAMLQHYIEATLAGEQARRGWFYVDGELVQMFKELYTNTTPELKRATYDLVNSLVRRGGSQFWSLRDALK